MRSRYAPLTGASLLVTALALVLAGGCGKGDYSNEDLEFISALPERGDVTASIPSSSASAPADQAELYVATRKAINDFNRLVDVFLGLIDTVRSNRPTVRLPDERIWGPFPAAMNPGWDVQMIVDRNADMPFSYRLDFRRGGTLTTAATGWLTLLSGEYQPVAGVRKGMGHIDIQSQTLRDAGFDPGLDNLVEVHVAYDTRQFPLSVTLSFTSLPVQDHPEIPTEGSYVYAAQSDGRATLAYDIWAAAIAGAAGVQKMNVTAAWLGTGAGRADGTMTAGDAAGQQQTECWDDQLRTSYNDKPWAESEDVPAIPPGEPALHCKTIPAL